LEFCRIFFVVENGSAIQEQDRWFAFSDRFYRLCSPGKTARALVASRRAGLDGALYGTGVENGDAPVTLGKRAGREKDADQERQQQWKEKPFHLNLR
jgi:hypothetical protein